MNASSSGVACSAAKIRSPSFSRSSSSTTITARPAAMSATALSMSANMTISQHLLDVLGDHVDLEVDGVADGFGTEDGELERGRDEPDAERVGGDLHDGQRDAVDGDRALLHHVAGQLGRQREAQHLPLVGGLAGDDRADPVDVALHEVPAEPGADGRGALQVDLRAGFEHAERGTPQALPHHVGREDAVGVVDDGQADAVDRDRVAVPGVGRHDGPAYGEDRRVATRVGEVDDLTQFLDDAGEHQESFQSVFGWWVGWSDGFCRSDAVKRRSGPICVMSLRSSSSASAMVVTPASTSDGWPAPSNLGAI